MTFSNFKNIVKEKYPEAEMFAHGEFAGNKINVAIIFNPNNPKVYKYNGTYCEVLNKLGFKAIYRHDLENQIATLEMLQKLHGTEGFWGDIIDNSKEIERVEQDITNFKENYIIV